MTSKQDKANPPPFRRKEVIGNCTLYLGDSFDAMRSMPHASVDSVVTDPPYGIRFMGKAWDGADIVAQTLKRSGYHGDDAVRAGIRGGHRSIAAEAGKYDLSKHANRAFQDWTKDWAIQALRILKPGGHLLSFASPRTYHRMASGIEDAGFEIRDQIMWIFGSGFPKSHNLEGDWEGWGTALKPAHEPIVLARKPLTGTVALNVHTHSTGALNIAGCRISTEENLREGSGGLFSHIRDGKPFPKQNRAGEQSADTRYTEEGSTSFALKPGVRGGDPSGRWPANIIHDGSDEVMAAFPESNGQQGAVTGLEPSSKTNNVYSSFNGRPPTTPRGDSGSAARFYYCAKASQEDRDEGLEYFTPKQQDTSRKEGKPGGDNPRNRGLKRRANHHPTVKPTDLMRYLCRLITPPHGTVLDPFMGSGSTGKAAIKEGFLFIGIEREEEYFNIAQKRLLDAQRQPDMFHQAAHQPIDREA